MTNFHRRDNIVLNGLKTNLIEANYALATAKAVEKALSARLSAFETDFEAASAASTISGQNYSNGLKAATSLYGNEAASKKAGTIARAVEEKSRSVFNQAYTTAEQTVDAAYAIVAVQTVKDEIVAKNQLKAMPADYIAKFDQAVEDAEAAVAAATNALQQAMLAYAAATKAAATVDSVTSTINKTLGVMAKETDFPIRDVKTYRPQSGLLNVLYKFDDQLQARTKLLREVTHQATVELKNANNALAAAQATEQGAEDALRAGLIAVNRTPSAAAVALVRQISAQKTG